MYLQVALEGAERHVVFVLSHHPAFFFCHLNTYIFSSCYNDWFCKVHNRCKRAQPLALLNTILISQTFIFLHEVLMWTVRQLGPTEASQQQQQQQKGQSLPSLVHRTRVVQSCNQTPENCSSERGDVHFLFVFLS